MRIVIDAGPTAESVKSGVAFYTLNLVNNILKLDENNEYIMYGLNPTCNYLFKEFKNTKIRNISEFFVSKPLWYYWTYLSSSFIPNIMQDKPDIYFSTYPALPPYCPSPKIITVYDLTPIVLKSAYRLRFRLTFSMRLKQAFKQASKIIVISESTKNDLINIFKDDRNKIDIIYPGYDKETFKPDYPKELIDQSLSKYGIKGSYILYAGTLEPKKNISRLIESFSILKKNNMITHKLVLTGKKSWRTNLIFETIDKFSLKEEIIFTDYVPEKDLALIMSGADLFIFPSLHEGFGIPPLEAMACGTPVITSNTSSLPEVVGDAGILINPYDIQQMADAIYKVLSDHNLRAEMTQKGLERAKLFSWEESAGKMLAIFESVYQSSHKK